MVMEMTIVLMRVSQIKAQIEETDSDFDREITRTFS